MDDVLSRSFSSTVVLEKGAAMNSDPTRSSSRWAPWWVYVAVIAPANLGKEQLLPEDAAWWIRAGLTAAIVMGGVAVVTAIYRASRPRAPGL
jgi:hypothetical protein